MVGLAFTVHSVGDMWPVCSALQQAQQSHVLVIDGYNAPHALADDLIAAEAKHKSLAGVVVAGACRNPEGIAKIGLPFFASAMSPIKAPATAQRGKTQVPLTLGHVTVYPNEFIIADSNGIIVLSEKELLTLMPIAEAIQNRENRVLFSMKHGASVMDLVHPPKPAAAPHPVQHHKQETEEAAWV